MPLGDRAGPGDQRPVGRGGRVGAVPAAGRPEPGQRVPAVRDGALHPLHRGDRGAVAGQLGEQPAPGLDPAVLLAGLQQREGAPGDGDHRGPPPARRVDQHADVGSAGHRHRDDPQAGQQPGQGGVVAGAARAQRAAPGVLPGQALRGVPGHDRGPLLTGAPGEGDERHHRGDTRRGQPGQRPGRAGGQPGHQGGQPGDDRGELGAAQPEQQARGVPRPEHVPPLLGVAVRGAGGRCGPGRARRGGHGQAPRRCCGGTGGGSGGADCRSLVTVMPPVWAAAPAPVRAASSPAPTGPAAPAAASRVAPA